MEPESYDAPYVMGIIAEYQHDYKAAKEWYDKALARNPNYEQAKARLDQLKGKINEEGDAKKRCQKVESAKEGRAPRFRRARSRRSGGISPR